MTAGEQRLWDYLTIHGYKFDFEPSVSGRMKRPDFLVPHGDHGVVLEVKDLVKDRVPRDDDKARNFDPYRGTRDKINQARQKFREFKDHPCGLVIFNVGDPHTRLDHESIFAAMLGDQGIGMDFDPTRGRARPESARGVFVPGRGSMLHGPKEIQQNRTVSAVIALEQQLLASKRSTCIGVLPAANGARQPLTVLRVVVCKNPAARHPIPQGFFCGPCDECWECDGLRLERTFCGSEVSALQFPN